MNKAITILACLAFAFSGAMLALSGTDPSPGTGYKTATAVTMPRIQPIKFPAISLDTGTVDIPEDIVRDLAKKKGVLDTVYITKTDTIKEQVTKVKWRKVTAPKPVVVRDTIREAHYYIATRSGNKEGPDGTCVSVYEVHEVDKICPEITNSSVQLMNESDIDVGE